MVHLPAKRLLCEISLSKRTKITGKAGDTDGKRMISESRSTALVPKIGTFEDCLKALESEKRVFKLVKICDAIDGRFGVSTACTADQLIERAVNIDCKTLVALSGYGHLLMAENMRAQLFDQVEINKEIDKAEAMLSYANLGGRHPWLPRAQKLKRIVNWKSYGRLFLSVVGLLTFIVVIGLTYRFISSLDLDSL